MLRTIFCMLLASLALLPAAAAGQSDTETPAGLPEGITNNALLNSRYLLFGSDNRRRSALRWVRRRGDADMAAPLISALRYLEPEQRVAVLDTLKRITRKRTIGDDWHRWMIWQEQHPEITPFDGFDVFKSALLASIDENFLAFVYPGVEHEIRLEEIVWGGVVKDGIPALNDPAFVTADKADYLDEDEQVFGVFINGDARAYPYRIMDWHEMFNDIVGGVPVALAYCTLCGSGILYRTQPDEHAPRLMFGSSGLLYRSNKLMYDTASHSLWNQFTGRPVVGALTGSGRQLEVLPVLTTSWAQWRREHPETLVLDPNTGFQRDYRPGAPYGSYFKSSKLMFPAAVSDTSLDAKDEVFVLRVTGADTAWPLDAFEGGAVINDRVGTLNLVIIGDTATRTVRAYRSDGQLFSRVGEGHIESDGIAWQITEDALVGPEGQRLGRLPGHLAYWFAWSNYHPQGRLFRPEG